MTAEADATPRILVVTRNLPPLVGGMERLIWHVLDELRADYEVYAIGPRGAQALAPDGVEVTEVPESPLWRFLPCAMWKAVRKTVSLRPTLAMAGSGLTAPFAWLAARLVRARAAVYLHGLDIETPHRLYRALWLPFIRRCDIVLVNSRFTRGLARQAGVEESRIRILLPLHVHGRSPPFQYYHLPLVGGRDDLPDRAGLRADHAVDVQGVMAQYTGSKQGFAVPPADWLRRARAACPALAVDQQSLTSREARHCD